MVAPSPAPPGQSAEDTCAEEVCPCCGPCACEDKASCEGNCASLLCGAAASCTVRDPLNPQGWPACASCGARRAELGDRVEPL